MQPSPLIFPTAPSVPGTYKATPESFQVTEDLGFEPSGRGEHLFFWIQKRNISTHEVAAELAELLNLPRRAISYSGRKDKFAVTRQWFSAHRPGIDRPRLKTQANWKVLEVTRNTRHLKVGAHRANHFDVLVEAELDDSVTKAWESIQSLGMPNYFGPQRFGFNNLARALDGQVDEMALAAARSELFNRMLAGQVRSGDWLKAIPGEPCLRTDSNAWVMSASQAQIDDGAVDPCLPLFGPTPGIDESRLSEWQRAFKQDDALFEVLSQHKWGPHRRRSRVRPVQPSLEVESQGIRIRATLPTGAFMSVLLASLFDPLVEGRHAHPDQ